MCDNDNDGDQSKHVWKIWKNQLSILALSFNIGAPQYLDIICKTEKEIETKTESWFCVCVCESCCGVRPLNKCWAWVVSIFILYVYIHNEMCHALSHKHRTRFNHILYCMWWPDHFDVVCAFVVWHGSAIEMELRIRGDEQVRMK